MCARLYVETCVDLKCARQEKFLRCWWFRTRLRIAWKGSTQRQLRIANHVSLSLQFCVGSHSREHIFPLVWILFTSLKQFTSFSFELRGVLKSILMNMLEDSRRIITMQSICRRGTGTCKFKIEPVSTLCKHVFVKIERLSIESGLKFGFSNEDDPFWRACPFLETSCLALRDASDLDSVD